MELRFWKCDRCAEEWRDETEPRTEPETLTMKMSDCCMGTTSAVDIHFKHLCRKCVHGIAQIAYSVENADPIRKLMEKGV